MLRCNFLVGFVLILVSLSSYGMVRLPALITGGMVLQQQHDIKLWGWSSNEGQPLKVNGSWNNDTLSTTVINGKWEITLRTPGYGGPYVLTFVDNDTLRTDDVLIGEVWLASGQSNMAIDINYLHFYFNEPPVEEAIKNANNPYIRTFNVYRQQSNTEQDDCPGYWKPCNWQYIYDFSAVGYFFAKNLYDSLKIPIGIINASWGGTNAETWVKDTIVFKNDFLYNGYKLLSSSFAPGTAYNAMIHPLQKYAIKGVIWYQGESNKLNANVYRDLMANLIANWRKGWGIDFPFYYVQIAPFDYADGISSNLLREAQFLTLSVPKTGMVVTNDIGDLNDIHPRNKAAVGYRLALWALAKDYGYHIAFSGPLYKWSMREDNRIMVHFDYAEGGLISTDATLNEFEIAGNDNRYLPATAKIVGETVEVYNNDIAEPQSVRFAFSDLSQPNLYNLAGLPASTFCTNSVAEPILYTALPGQQTHAAHLWPNPAASGSAIIHYTLKNNRIANQITIMNMQGNIVFGLVGLNQNSGTLPLSGLNRGLYMVRFNTGKKIVYEQLIIK